MMTNSTYTTFQAAQFLGISEGELVEMAVEGKIRKHWNGRCSFYLGGDLDVARCLLRSERESAMRGSGLRENDEKLWSIRKRSD